MVKRLSANPRQKSPTAPFTSHLTNHQSPITDMLPGVGASGYFGHRQTSWVQHERLKPVRLIPYQAFALPIGGQALAHLACWIVVVIGDSSLTDDVALAVYEVKLAEFFIFILEVDGVVPIRVTFRSPGSSRHF
jgi:hypothetical protein